MNSISLNIKFECYSRVLFYQKMLPIIISKATKTVGVLILEITQFYRIKGRGGSGRPPPPDNF